MLHLLHLLLLLLHLLLLLRRRRRLKNDSIVVLPVESLVKNKNKLSTFHLFPFGIPRGSLSQSVVKKKKTRSKIYNCMRHARHHASFRGRADLARLVKSAIRQQRVMNIFFSAPDPPGAYRPELTPHAIPLEHAPRQVTMPNQHTTHPLFFNQAHKTPPSLLST